MEPKHVILTAHKNPGQVLQLALRLDDGATTIWLHVDSRLPLEDWSGVLCLPHVKAVEPRYASRWGTFGVSQALIQCIDAVADSGSAGYTFLVSGQDWPLLSRATLDGWVREHQDELAIDTGPIEEVWPNWWRWKTDFYAVSLGDHRDDIHLLRPLRRMNVREIFGWSRRIVTALGAGPAAQTLWTMRRDRRAPVPRIQAGSMWWGLPWEAVRRVSGHLKSQPELMEYFRFTQCSDEVIVHTTLAASGAMDNWRVTESPTHVEWDEGHSGSPHVFVTGDLPRLQAAAATKVFARKFDFDRDARVVELLDAGP